MLRKESARYISRNYIASVMQLASGRTIPFLSLAIARARARKRGFFLISRGHARERPGRETGRPHPLPSSPLLLPPPRLFFDPAVRSDRKIGAETNASDKIEATLRCKRPIVDRRSWREGRRESTGHDLQDRPGRRTDASQRPTDSATYIRKFLPTFASRARDQAVVVGLVPRNRIAS
jgi:hypothetical protein